jgi:hypothetical protein
MMGAKVLTWGMALRLFGIAMVWLVVRFAHPELTETQLMIKYWYLVLASVLLPAVLLVYRMLRSK